MCDNWQGHSEWPCGVAEKLHVAIAECHSVEELKLDRIIHHVSEKNVCYVVFSNLKNPEPIFITFGLQCPDNPSF